jgi:hypothetical protein
VLLRGSDRVVPSALLPRWWYRKKRVKLYLKAPDILIEDFDRATKQWYPEPRNTRILRAMLFFIQECDKQKEKEI